MDEQLAPHVFAEIERNVGGKVQFGYGQDHGEHGEQDHPDSGFQNIRNVRIDDTDIYHIRHEHRQIQFEQ